MRFVAVALFNENDDFVIDQLAYNVSAKTVNIMDTVLPKNKIVPKSEYVVNDMYNVTQVGEYVQETNRHSLNLYYEQSLSTLI